MAIERRRQSLKSGQIVVAQGQKDCRILRVLAAVGTFAPDISNAVPIPHPATNRNRTRNASAGSEPRARATSGDCWTPPGFAAAFHEAARAS